MRCKQNLNVHFKCPPRPKSRDPFPANEKPYIQSWVRARSENLFTANGQRERRCSSPGTSSILEPVQQYRPAELDALTVKPEADRRKMWRSSVSSTNINTSIIKRIELVNWFPSFYMSEAFPVSTSTALWTNRSGRTCALITNPGKHLVLSCTEVVTTNNFSV